MKATCKQCKAVIQMADTEGVAAALAEKMKDHVKREHTKPVDVLAAVREQVSICLNTSNLEDGRAATVKLCELLDLPVPEHYLSLEGEKHDANSSSVSGKAVPVGGDSPQGTIPAKNN